VFALCCSYTGYLFSFEIYTGKDDRTVGSAKAIIERLLLAAAVTGVGRILYVDNWYTSIDVIKHVWQAFGFLVVGTMVLTKKKSRAADDFPFAKLSAHAIAVSSAGGADVQHRR
jgi:hypothetical protein